MGAANAAKHHKDKETAGDVQRHDQLRQRTQRGDAVLPDCERQRPEGTDRRKAHQVGKDLENHLRCGFEHIEYRLAALTQR
ncbi:hypothetical protein D3C87_1838400 [compost metagenome]